MDVAAFVLSILALLFALLGLGLSMRALYIIGVNSGLAKPQENKEKTTIQTPKKFTPKKPIRTEGEKIIYNEDPLVYVIENFISCLLYTSPSPRDTLLSRMPSSA